MFFTIFFANPAFAIAWLVAIFLSLTVHEFSHALVGKLRGDKTAEYSGRLSLNPIKHIDPIGLVPLLFFGFGWAKPVPFNPYNLHDPKWDSVKIALAGPFSNFLLALVAGIGLRIVVPILGIGNLLVAFLFLMVLLNLFLMFFNLVPIHPLDGSKLFFALFDKPQHQELRKFVAVRGPQILMVLVFVAILTNIDVFFFVSAPSFATCNALIGGDCNFFFAQLLGGI